MERGEFTLVLKKMIYAACFAAVVAVLGLIPPIPLPFIPAHISAQTLGVMLAGSILGARTGALSLFIFTILVILGAPLLAGGRGGLAVVLAPTGGYFLSWTVGAFVIGFIVERLKNTPLFWKYVIANVVGGILVIYAIGIPYMSIVTDLPMGPLAVGNIAFLPGDAIKVLVASLIAARVYKAVGDITK